MWQSKKAQKNSDETRHEDTLYSLFATSSRSSHLKLNPKEECCRMVCFVLFCFFSLLQANQIIIPTNWAKQNKLAKGEKNQGKVSTFPKTPPCSLIIY